MKRPAFQFYPSDWRRDAALQSCSVSARGLWIELMCVMHDCEPYGVLSVNGKPMSIAQIARLVGEHEKVVGRLLTELEDAGVCSRDDQGRLFSRRMVKDEGVREARASGGHAGAEHGHKGALHGKKGGRPRKVEAGSSGEEKTPLKTPLDGFENPPPSSSSSSSPSVNSVPIGTGAAVAPPADPVGLDVAGKPDKPPLTPDEIIFGYGVPMLINAGTPEKQARSFLGALRKRDEAGLINALRDCLRAKPLQPLEWLAAALPPPVSAGKSKPPPASSFAQQDREIGMARWEQMTGRVHPDRHPAPVSGEVIDVTPKANLLEAP